MRASCPVPMFADLVLDRGAMSPDHPAQGGQHNVGAQTLTVTGALGAGNLPRVFVAIASLVCVAAALLAFGARGLRTRRGGTEA